MALLRVVSVSIGSSKRDHTVTAQFCGQDVEISRIGTDGDMQKAKELLRELDGSVDALGLGGIDLYVWCAGRRYTFRDAQRMVSVVQRTPVADGTYVKNYWESQVLQRVAETSVLDFTGKRALLVSAVDRAGMAEGLSAVGCQVLYGDVIFALGLPIPLYSRKSLDRLGRVLLPVVTKLPFKLLYPTGKDQEKAGSSERKMRYYRWADLIAGDFHYIRRHMPEDMQGKIILSNTLTADDVAELRRRGVRLLITTTPDLGGRSYGTNVMEAVICALARCRPNELTAADYGEWFKRLDFQPRLERFN